MCTGPAARERAAPAGGGSAQIEEKRPSPGSKRAAAFSCADEKRKAALRDPTRKAAFLGLKKLRVRQLTDISQLHVKGRIPVLEQLKGAFAPKDRVLGALPHGEDALDSGPLARGALQEDPPAVEGDCIPAEGQPQPGGGEAPIRPVGEVGFKHLGLQGRFRCV